MRHLLWRRITITSILATSPLLSSYGASFDCQHARSFREHTVCSNVELSELDDNLSRTYTVARANANEPSALRATQKAWLASADRCGDLSCLTSAYRQRIAELTGHDVASDPSEPENASAATNVDSAVASSSNEASNPASDQVASPSPSPTQRSKPPLASHSQKRLDSSGDIKHSATMNVVAPTANGRSMSSKEPPIDLKLILEITAALFVLLIASGFYFYSNHFDKRDRDKGTYWIRFFFMYVFWVATGMFWFTIGTLKFVASACLSGRSGSSSQGSTGPRNSTKPTFYCVHRITDQGQMQSTAIMATYMTSAIQSAQHAKRCDPESTFVVRECEEYGHNPGATVASF